MPKLIFDRVTYSTKSWAGSYDLEFEEGRCYAVCGPSGSGKSTLANLAAGFLTPKTGDIKLGDISIACAPPHKRGISLMSQSDGLFPGISLEENLLLALHDSNDENTRKWEKINTLTNSLGLDPSLLKRLPSQISGGQLSRCNLARALLRPCKWLILDEPFAAVDRPTRIQILGWLDRWIEMKRTSVVMIAHDLDDVFTVATHVTVIDDGVVVEHASLSEAMLKPKSSLGARLLRSGLVFSENREQYFVASENIITSRKESETIPPSFRGNYIFTSAKCTPSGRCLRIIDHVNSNDFTVSINGIFENEVWFDKRLRVELPK